MWSPLNSSVTEGFPNPLEECESPKIREEYERIAKATLKKLVELELGGALEGWTEVDAGLQSEETYLFEKNDSNSAIACLRSETTIHRSPKALFDLMWNADFELRRRWDPELLKMEVLETITPQIQVVHRTYKAPASIIAPRDFIALNARWASNGSFATYGTSINHPLDRASPKYVRGRAIVTGFIFRPVEGKVNECRCIRIVQIDPKGLVPSWVVNVGKKRAAQALVRMKNIMEELIPLIPKIDVATPAYPIAGLFGPVAGSSSPPPYSHQDELLSKQLLERGPQKSQPTSQKKRVQKEQVRELMTSLVASLSDLQASIGKSNERLEKVEHLLQVEEINRSRMESTKALQLSRLEEQTSATSWNFVAFALTWPFLAYTALDFLSSRRK
eukprot:TRINITY_DN11600_c0_g1_i1.p1 TRINITY_DN11600_c0_g1~~TRINITY_DN11600_c0_g1_i1.p1  ORF type:complete len:389 (-),score=79.14 TRINITY_DN11600_c0_g1_i1:37-1203(-)